ncbi:hypothetical protein DSECCO2_400360 [anaerobic digester metagenome]
MQSCPFLYGRCSNLVSYPGVFPDFLTDRPGVRFILALPYKAQAAPLIVFVNQPGNGSQFADLAAPACVHRRGPENSYGLPERIPCTRSPERLSIIFRNLFDVFKGFRKLKPGICKHQFVIFQSFIHKL